jgi:hypothetical protein
VLCSTHVVIRALISRAVFRVAAASVAGIPAGALAGPRCMRVALVLLLALLPHLCAPDGAAFPAVLALLLPSLCQCPARIAKSNFANESMSNGRAFAAGPPSKGHATNFRSRRCHTWPVSSCKANKRMKKSPSSMLQGQNSA